MDLGKDVLLFTGDVQTAAAGEAAEDFTDSEAADSSGVNSGHERPKHTVKLTSQALCGKN